MKKLLFTIIVSLVGFGILQAQTERGNLLIGGNAGLSLFKRNGQDKLRFNLDFSPKAGFFLVDNFAIGAQLTGVIRNRAGIDGLDSSVLFGPFARYYFHNLFLEANIGFLETDLLTGMGIGYAFFVNNNVAIEPIINARYLNSLDVNILIGFQLYFTAQELQDAF